MLEALDHKIIDWLVDEFKKAEGIDLSKDRMALQRLKEAAEKAKIELADAEVASIDLPFLAKSAKGAQLNFSCTLSRKQMVALCKPLIERTLELCERCLSTARISRGEVGEVLLVGGQSRMIAVRDGVKDFFSKEPRRDINPDEVVAVGAALYAYSLSADTLQQEAHEAAEDAFEVALRQTEVARKIVKEVEELRARPLDDQGLAARLQTLLVDCRNVKVKRLFFFFADRHQHAWLKRLDRSAIDLGSGKRMLVKGGRFDAKHLITVPETFDGVQ